MFLEIWFSRDAQHMAIFTGMCTCPRTKISPWKTLLSCASLAPRAYAARVLYLSCGGRGTQKMARKRRPETQEARCPGFLVILPWHLCESDVRPGCPVCVTLFLNDREALRSACLPLDGPCTTPSSSVSSILVSSAEKGGPPSVHHSQRTLFHACITGFHPTSFRPHPSTVRELRVVARNVMMPSCQKI